MGYSAPVNAIVPSVINCRMLRIAGSMAKGRFPGTVMP
jgi:hypothetical protein